MTETKTKTRKKKAPYTRLIVAREGSVLTVVQECGDISTVKAKAALKRLEKADGNKYELIYVVA